MESTLSTEEILKQHTRWTYARTDRNGTRYFTDCTCGRCGGRGVIDSYKFVEGGVCFECGGSGISKPETIKIYTPEYAAKLEARRQERAAKARQEREAKAISERADKLAKLGFGKEGETFVLYRVVGNTFPIKDQLKEAGARFNPCVGWYFAEEKPQWECQRLTEAEVLDDSVYINWKSRQVVEPLWTERNRAAQESTSEWQGTVGARIEVEVHIDRRFESQFVITSWKHTTSYMYLMTDKDGNKYKWSTSKYFNEGEDVKLKGSVKEHAEYKGIKQTVLTRCSEI